MFCGSSLSTITRIKFDIKSILGTNVYHVPRLCLLDIGGAPVLVKTMQLRYLRLNLHFTFGETSLIGKNFGQGFNVKQV